MAQGCVAHIDFNFAELVHATPYLSDLQRRFYVRYLEERRRVLFLDL